VAALRFFFRVTLKRSDIIEHTTFIHEPRKLPVVLSPDAIKRYAQKVASPEDFVRRSIPKIYPKSALQTDEMKDLDGIQRDAVKLKFLDQPLGKEQLAELLQIPPR
jgi:hypothetical protein